MTRPPEQLLLKLLAMWFCCCPAADPARRSFSKVITRTLWLPVACTAPLPQASKYGRARVIAQGPAQGGEGPEDVQIAMETCPVDCIYWVGDKIAEAQ